MENNKRNTRNRNFPQQYLDYDRDWRNRDFGNRNNDISDPKNDSEAKRNTEDIAKRAAADIKNYGKI